MKAVVLAALFATVCLASSGGFLEKWTYVEDPANPHQPKAPEKWGEVYPQCGQRLATEKQSPINIEARHIVARADLQPLVFSYTPYNAHVHNTGASVDVVADKGAASQVLQGGLGGEYKLAGLHLHWNNRGNNGSEHALSGFRTAGEIHFVHHSSAFKDLGEAVESGQPAAVAVVGVLVALGPVANSEFQKIAAVLPHISHPGAHPEDSEVAVPNFDPRGLLPKASSSYFHYNGSLTTPGCNEIVRWYVLQHIAYISASQLAALRAVPHSAHNVTTSVEVYHNVRPLQPVNGRKIFAYPQYHDKMTVEQKIGSPIIAGVLLGLGLAGTVVVLMVFAVIIFRAGHSL